MQATSSRVAVASLLCCAACATGFRATPVSRPPAAASRSSPVAMKDWSKRKTLAEQAGGVQDAGAAAVGLTGTIPVEFSQGNDTLSTMAMVGQPLGDVASQAGQYIKYKCRKGECGTCEVRVDGKWIRTCTATVPYVGQGEKYSVFVRPSMVPKGKKSSRFFSFRSFIAGFRNNLLGMFGFVREGRKSKNQFKERMQIEQDILAKAAAKRAARLAAKQGDAP